jgi:hypothetical protein
MGSLPGRWYCILYHYSPSEVALIMQIRTFAEFGDAGVGGVE